jgi:hypothetical protein
MGDIPVVGRRLVTRLNELLVSLSRRRHDPPRRDECFAPGPRSLRSGQTGEAPEERPVDLIVNYTNGVQCGATTAEGGRPKLPESGDRPIPGDVSR